MLVLIELKNQGRRRKSKEENHQRTQPTYDVTCDQALFSFRSVKHSGGKGETKNRA